MAKYHVNAKGEPGLCRARTACPFGGADEHYPSKEAAQIAFEKSMDNAPTSRRKQENEEAPMREVYSAATQGQIFRAVGEVVVPGSLHHETKRRAVLRYVNSQKSWADYQAGTTQIRPGQTVAQHRLVLEKLSVSPEKVDKQMRSTVAAAAPKQ